MDEHPPAVGQTLHRWRQSAALTLNRLATRLAGRAQPPVANVGTLATTHRRHTQALAHAAETGCRSELLQKLAVETAGAVLEPPSRESGTASFAGLLLELVDAEPEPCGGLETAVFNLHTARETDLLQAAVTAVSDLPHPEAAFARRQWRALLRIVTAVRAYRPGLRGEIFTYAATRAFGEYRLERGDLDDAERECAEALALALRHAHARFRATHPGLGEAAYVLAPLALLERLRAMFPITDRGRPGAEPRTGVSTEIH